ncbi:NADPH-dependent FMN reductase [Devosia sp. 919]|uniref:NADPH-dependent FMN reductase n=1 Tax=Devosia sp. 919 TaxID=2726065 RepID=UPI001553F672|nr:NADPH-dependent FMN reductase [Devosia sp. 919]
MATALTLSGSIRRGSLNRVLQHHIGRKLTQAGVAVTQLELGDFPMPLFNEDLEPDQVPEAAPVLAQLFASHDIIFWASPEYNGGMTPLTVNTIAWLSRQKPNPFRHAVFGIGGVSSGKYGAVMGQSHLRDSLSKLGALVVPTLLGIGPGAAAFDADGNPTEKSVVGKIEQLVHDLTHFSRG